LDWSGLGMASWPASQYETAAWPCSQPEGGRGTLGGGGRAGPRLLQARLQAPVGLQRSEHVRMVGLLQRKARREVALSVTVQRSYSLVCTTLLTGSLAKEVCRASAAGFASHLGPAEQGPGRVLMAHRLRRPLLLVERNSATQRLCNSAAPPVCALAVPCALHMTQ